MKSRHLINPMDLSVDELDEILNKKREKFTSICVRFGNVKSRKEM